MWPNWPSLPGHSCTTAPVGFPSRGAVEINAQHNIGYSFWLALAPTSYEVSPPHKVGLEFLQSKTVRGRDNKIIVQALLGLGILTPPSVTTVKSEHGTLSPHQGTLSHQYNLLDPGTGVSSVVTDLTTLQVLEILELCDFILHVYN